MNEAKDDRQARLTGTLLLVILLVATIVGQWFERRRAIERYERLAGPALRLALKHEDDTSSAVVFKVIDEGEME